MNKVINKKITDLNLRKILRTLQQKREYIHSEYRIVILGIFGSYSRNEQRNKSDIDILVSYNQDATLFNKIALKDYLENLFLVKIDLVAEKYIKPVYHDSIMNDLIRLRPRSTVC
jgi:hypothetical protein